MRTVALMMNRFPTFSFAALLLSGLGASCLQTARAAEAPASVRWVRVPLSGQEHNAIQESWPGLGCWFWTEREFAPDGYREFLDRAERLSAFGLLTTSIRAPKEVTDPAVHDQIKRAAEYASTKSMKVVMDLDVRLARQAFKDRYPEELQEIVRLRQVKLKDAGEVELLVPAVGGGDHYTFHAPPYYPVASRLLRVYAYTGDTNGGTATTVEDITARCRVLQADDQGLKVAIPCQAADRGRTACILAVHSLFTPDVFAPHLIPFERAILQQYADVPLAGACKDEWGFPGGMANSQNLWFSRAMAEAYAQRRPGLDLARDLFLMSVGERGREAERMAAINHYLEMFWRRNAEVETAFYRGIKEVFGPGALSATHPTWFPYPNANEVFKNGLDWWCCQRDLAQTDESTPFCARTALAKKWHCPLWYNMLYDRQWSTYEEGLWRHALAGGRINFHPLYPGPWQSKPWALAQSPVLRAAARVGLLDTICTAPVDCPVAVVFGHPCALNWAGDGFADAGVEVANALWAQGYYADLIPSSEIALGQLKLDTNGVLQYGPQRYAAAILYHPQYESAAVADLFLKAAAAGQTAVTRVGEWTLDFEGQPSAAAVRLGNALPSLTGRAAVEKMVAALKAAGVAPQTPSALHTAAGFTPSMMPDTSGQCRLLDGTVVMASGTRDVMGDPLRRTVRVPARAGSSAPAAEVTFDAIGLAAVRLDEAGQIEALAAGGLKSLRAPGLSLDLDPRVDLALWRDAKGRWRGVLLGHEGAVPEPLARLTAEWTRLRWPETLPRE